MRKRPSGIHMIGLGIVATLGGCSGKNSTNDDATTASGGNAAIGGAAATGGSMSSGGVATQTQGGIAAGGTGFTNPSSNGGNPAGGTGGGGSSSGGSSSGGSSSGGNGNGGATSAGGTSARGGAGGSATSGASGASTGGAVATGGLWRGPTAATPAARFPFPQNRQSASCVYPKDYKNEDVQAVYDKWKADLVTSDGSGGFRRVKRPNEPGLEVNSTVSEGIAYGMIIAVYMNDQALFDDLWKYALAHSWTYAAPGGGSKSTILMNWYISSSGSLGSNPSGGGAATDADEDMAWALIMADKQWSGQGSLSKSYLEYAKQLLSDIWSYEILDGKLPKNGSGWGDWNSLNISYFAPAYYRVFAKVSGNAPWGTDVVKCVYDTIDGNLTAANANQSNGLVPAFSTSTGGDAWVSAGQSPQRHDYQYDSCRTPFRIGLDACLFNDARAKSYVAKTSQFFAGIGAANIKDGYSLSGNPTPEYGGTRGYQGRSAAFIGPAGVGAMHNSSYQSFVDDVWGLIRQNNMWCGGQYYDESWTMLTMLMMSGNLLDYTVETPK
jgi:endo-1,4-beta-D-glucanase Y